MDKNKIKEFLKHVWKESEATRYVVGAFMVMKLVLILLEKLDW